MGAAKLIVLDGTDDEVCVEPTNDKRDDGAKPAGDNVVAVVTHPRRAVGEAH